MDKGRVALGVGARFEFQMASGKAPLREKVQFIVWPSAVMEPGATLACWLNKSESGSSMLKVDVVLFHSRVSQLESAS